ncbi:hypothetical protein NDU88_003627 [Pleurodeles waltl]|uniref:Uncharacterized protein n=1 Tax=Pleurodeles waltl TaxID=8319 RepID=A0AAV7W660_PLEWA|nr:hypothetical protein NDU88_003627 [Pleurodeles waltl]
MAGGLSGHEAGVGEHCTSGGDSGTGPSHSTNTMRRHKTAGTSARLLDSRVPLTQAEGSNGSGSRDYVPPTNSPPSADKLDLILQEICESQAAIEHRIDTIATDLGILKDDHKKSATKVCTAPSPN